MTTKSFTFRGAAIVIASGMILFLWFFGFIDLDCGSGSCAIKNRILSMCNFVNPCEVKGLIGSEKERFFEDERVSFDLRRWGLSVLASPMGSNEMIRHCQGQGFLFPAGTFAGRELTEDNPRCRNAVEQETLVWSSPLVLAVRENPFKALLADGTIYEEGGLYKANTGRLLKYVAEEKFWSELKGNTFFKKDLTIILRTTDLTSNSSTQMCALASTQLKGRLPSIGDVEEIADFCYRILCYQGEKKNTTRPNWEEFLMSNEVSAPIALVYEQLYMESKNNKNKNHPLPPGIFIIYPNPTVITTHTYVIQPDEIQGSRGSLLFQALKSDRLMKLAAEHGFRVNDAAIRRQQGYPEADTLPAMPDLGVIKEIQRRINEKQKSLTCPSKR